MAKKKPATTKKIEGTEIVRTNRMFISLKTIGEMDAKGKTVFSLGYSGKTVAEPERPLSTAVAKLVLHIANMAKYSTQEDMEADLKEFQAIVADIKWAKRHDEE